MRFTLKALTELAVLASGLDETDACEVLARLSATDFVERFACKFTGEWLYVFKPVLDDTTFYVKVALRQDCVVISFHEDYED